MNIRGLNEGVKKLNQLSEGDYRQPLEDVIAQQDPKLLFQQLGRLVGVALKEPFSTPRSLSAASPTTRSYQAWDLQKDRFNNPELTATWQYRTLNAMRQDLTDRGPFDSVLELAEDAAMERGFFGYIARSVKKHISDNAELRKQINQNIEAAKRAGFALDHPTLDRLDEMGGSDLAALLVNNIPTLVDVEAPVVAGFVLMFYAIGIDAFNEYVDTYYMADAEGKHD